MDTAVIPYEPYHPHLAYTAAITILAWGTAWIYGRLALRERPRVRVQLYATVIAIPLIAELGGYLIYRLRPSEVTPVGAALARFHATVLSQFPIDTFIGAALLQGLAAALALLLTVSLVRFLVGSVQLARFLSSARPLQLHRHPELCERLVIIAEERNLALPSIWIVPVEPPLALTSGVFRPRIYLAEHLLTLLSPDELLAVICHEWAHVVRRDNLWNAALRIARDMLPFLPGARIAWQSMIASEDEACDELAAQMTQQPLALARALVKVAKAWHAQHVPPLVAASPFALGNAAPRTRVEQMIRLDSDTAAGGGVPVVGAYLLMAGLLLLAVLPALLGS